MRHPRNPSLVWIAALVASLLYVAAAGAEPTQLLWGDTHLHSSNSFDAFLNRNMTADPDTAYRYAKGLPVIHPFHRARVQIETPLDFLVVADHAELLGVMPYILERGIPREGLGVAGRFRAWMAERWLRGVIERDDGMAAFSSFLPENEDTVEEAASRTPLGGTALPNNELISKTVWQEAIQTADAHNEPGVFTTLIGWEWSSIPAGANLHRVVFTSSAADVASEFHPWSSVDSMYPEDLWAWLEETSTRTGADFVAIPHNSNISKGYMFQETSLRGAPIDEAYAKLRAKWEPVVEATQIKGDSETHPDLSPDDPFADFELYPHYIEQKPTPYKAQKADYVRSALRRGLEIEQRIGFNPYAFGLIGSTDAHTGVASAEEPNFWGKLARDSTPETKAPKWTAAGGPNGWSMAAQGLAAVWAEGNNRASILAAFKRKEVYATTGPRMRVRVFGGWDFETGDAEASPLAEVGYSRGIPMGGNLSNAPAGGSPRFLIHALSDPKGAHLDRVQIIKGWVGGTGDSHEKVYDVTWSGERVVDATGTLPEVGNTVDTATASYTNEIGAPQLAGVWKDPAFDPAISAFYYVRVLEIPTPRHSVYDALALGQDPKEVDRPWFIQERAYTSPIWYRP